MQTATPPACDPDGRADEGRPTRGGACYVRARLGKPFDLRAVLALAEGAA